ncbi:MAG: heme lyase CcmF/NrfE family subunit [Alphaproteobacteria bacterium]|nr:heme lyase CcmF/NrfE family subunit [Alphaproteobacteria bacterium]
MHLTEIGHFALSLAFALAMIQSIMLFRAGRTGDLGAIQLGRISAHLTFVLVAASFIILTIAFIQSDFSVALVASHSHSLKPLLYKVSGVWGNHEGSLLLWVLILTLFGALMALRLKPLQDGQLTMSYALSVQGMIVIAFIGLILFTSNPFERLTALPDDGNGLNPILQDPGLAFHPPMLYLGYVGLSVGFAFAVAALIEGRADALWARLARRWVLIAWSALTAGIALGSWWAYYELGWGGWWFWDPVENASLMPWLVATALIHSLNVVEKRNLFHSWTVLMAILAFGLSLIGTFIVRSGLLTSVHAFTNDPTRGLVILVIILVAVGVPLLLFGWRAGTLAHDRASNQNSNQDTESPALISRETALQANNLLLVVTSATVLVGTLYPLIIEAINGARISVGPPFFEATVGPLLGLMLIVMPVAPLLAWKKAQAKSVTPYLLPMLLMTAAIMAVIIVMLNGISIFAIATLGLGVWVISGVIADIVAIMGGHRMTIRSGFQRLIGAPLPRIGMNMAHIGVAIFTIGVAGVSFFDSETITRMQINDSIESGSKTFTLTQVTPVQGPNYTAIAATVMMTDKRGKEVALTSEIRRFPVARSQTTEAAIKTGFWGDTYVVYGGGTSGDGFVIRIYQKPLITWIWGGAGLMMLGGLLAMGPRRSKPAQLTSTSVAERHKDSIA